MSDSVDWDVKRLSAIRITSCRGGAQFKLIVLIRLMHSCTICLSLFPINGYMKAYIYFHQRQKSFDVGTIVNESTNRDYPVVAATV